MVDRLQQHLSTAFGESNVFFDEQSIPAGVDFRSVLRGQLMRVDCLLAIIGPTYVSDRLLAPDDYVRFEVATALSLQLQVVPVLINEANVPVADALPPDMAQLAYRNAMRLRSDPHFDTDVAKLIQALELMTSRHDDEGPRSVVVGLPIPIPGTAVSTGALQGGAAPAHTAAVAHAVSAGGRSVGKLAKLALAGGVAAAAAGGTAFIATRHDDSPSRSIVTQAPTTTAAPTPVIPVITAVAAPGTSPPGAFPVALGDTIMPDQPAGAGHIDTPGGRDVYALTVTAGQSMYVPTTRPAQCTDTFSIAFTLPDGTKAGKYGNCSLDRRFDFTESGIVTIEVSSTTDWTGTYELQLGDIRGASGSPDDQFQLQIGSSIGPDQPSGAGHIETPGSHDVYKMTVTAGQSMYVPTTRAAQCTDTFTIAFTLPDGTKAGNYGNCSLDRRFDFTESGIVTIEVSGWTDWTGTYELEFAASGG